MTDVQIFGPRWQEFAERQANLGAILARIQRTDFEFWQSCQAKGNEMTETDCGFVPMKIKQNRGPTIEFEGRLLAETDWSSGERHIALELWQTRGGALIPVTRNHLPGKRDIITASVVEPADEASMRFAVMDQWDWEDRARRMVKDQLGWTLKRIVE